ncbi:MAG: LysR substrate-binding domain-containing protein [Pseudomonadota bacterium]
MPADLDIDLLRSFVAVVDAGGFTRGAERVHRTQSTVSQQIQRLEEAAGSVLLVRQGRLVAPTEEGVRLLAYARRILTLHEEARQMLAAEGPGEVVRLGSPEDFATSHLPRVLAGWARSRPRLRVEMRCDLSAALRRDLDRGDLDLAVVKQLPGTAGGLGVWREPLAWVAATGFEPGETVPLVVYPHGCHYRNHAIHALEAAGRRWRVAYASPSLTGLKAAVAAGLGVSPLPATAAAGGLAAVGGLPALPDSELGLYLAPGPVRPAVRDLADHVLASLDGAPLAA